MRYLLTITDQYGEEHDIARFTTEGDAYAMYDHLKIIRPLHREISVFKLMRGARIRLYHHDQRAVEPTAAFNG